MMRPVGFRPPMPQDLKSEEALQWQRFTEERRGLLSDQIHLEKYPQETLTDLSNAINDDPNANGSDIEDEQMLERREKQKMLEHVLYNDYQAMSTKKANKSTASGNKAVMSSSFN